MSQQATDYYTITMLPMGTCVGRSCMMTEQTPSHLQVHVQIDLLVKLSIHHSQNLCMTSLAWHENEACADPAAASGRNHIEKHGRTAMFQCKMQCVFLNMLTHVYISLQRPVICLLKK